MWHSARASTGSDRSRLQPPSLVSVAWSPVINPSSSKPISQLAWKGWRLPDMVMSWVRFSRSRTGRPVRVEPSAAIAAKPCGCISLPPKPPPIRRHCTVTACESRPSTWATISWVSDGMLGRALDEDLAVLVHQGERAVRLQVEVLLAAELELTGEPVGGLGQAGSGVTAGDGALMALERLLRDRLGERHQTGQRLVVDLDRLRATARGVQGLAQHPADGVPVEHHLGRGTAARRA